MKPRALSLRFSACLWILISLVTLPFPQPLFAGVFLRELNVGIAVAPSFKAIPRWKEQFARRLAYTSKIFEVEFKLKFKPRVYWDWNAPDERLGMQILMEDLRSQFPLKGVDLVIGLTHLGKPLSPGQVKDIHTIGQARPFGGYLVLRYPNNPLFRIQEETVLTHELGHVFGAVHIRDRKSIMSPIVETQLPSAFDPANRDIISMTREFDFTKGVDEMPAALSSHLAGAYLKLATSDQSGDFYHTLGKLYLRMNRPEDALKAWERARTIDPDNVVVHYDLGFLYYTRGEFDRSIRELGLALNNLPLNSQKNDKVKILEALGGAYYRKNNYFSANRSWNQALQLAPNNTELRINLALLQIANGKVEEGIRELQVFLKKDPHNVRLLSLIGSAYYRRGRYAECAQHLELAVKAIRKKGPGAKSGLDQNQLFETYQNLSLAYVKLKRQAEAVNFLKAACQMRPSPKCNEQLSDLYFQLKHWDESARLLAGIIQTQRDNPDIYAKLGVSLSQKGDYRQALSIFKEGLRYMKNPKAESNIHRNIGYLYFQLEQWDLALQEFYVAAAKNPSDAEIYVGMGLAKMKKMDLLGASELFKKTLAINPEHPKAAQLLQTVTANMEAAKNSPGSQGKVTIMSKQT